jgi:hypothetical protein
MSKPMNEVGEQTVRAVFEVDWKEVKRYDILNTLDFLGKLIPGSNYFYKSEYTKVSIDKGREEGLLQQKMNKTLYMITDDPNIVHWIAFEKRWEKMTNVIQRFLPVVIYIEPFYAEHLTWEG